MKVISIHGDLLRELLRLPDDWKIDRLDENAYLSARGDSGLTIYVDDGRDGEEYFDPVVTQKALDYEIDWSEK